jgi:hypothetical protein
MRARNVFLAAALVLTVACTGNSDSGTQPTTPTGSPPPTSDVNGQIVPGGWTYEYLGVKATFDWKAGGQPVLTVKNGSEQPVGAPGLYVVTRDQRHVDAKVSNSQPLDPSGSGEYQVSFPGGLVPDDIGLVVLELGDVNWGALGPKIKGS